MSTDIATVNPGANSLVAASNLGRLDSELSEFLTFRLGAEEYGIDILRVQEIRSYEAPTRIANAPDFIKGVVNLRGVIVPIVDLRLKFGLADAEYNSFTVVIILNLGRRVVGVVVDAVSDVVQLAPAQVKPAPQFSQVVDASYLLGLGSIAGRDGQPDRMLILVEIERLMTGADMGLFDVVTSLQ
ncbi:MAG: chemotaxis protein CheW [Paucibacter sp.]|nr:chemotaxis protein CheW [Roseateles sp.]